MRGWVNGKALLERLSEPRRQAPATCDVDGCSETQLTRCTLTAYRSEAPLGYWIDEVGVLRGLAKWLHLRRYGFVEYEPSYYCWTHARQEGFCPGCGRFCAGSERFDFSPLGLCSECEAQHYGEFEDDPRDWWEVEPCEN